MSVTLTIHNRNIRIAERDRQLIAAIVIRAADELVTLSLRGDINDLMADIALCHHRYRLDLEKLFILGKDEFRREIININRLVNRKTGEMPKAFMPRHLKKKEAV
jgi:hypothetical protein